MRFPHLLKVSLVSGAVFASLAFAGGANAHGEYDWINKGGYHNAEGVHCCGKDDCEAVAPDRVRETAKGYALSDYNVTVPFDRTIDSEDGKYWVCKSSGGVRCFFAPRGRF